MHGLQRDCVVQEGGECELDIRGWKPDHAAGDGERGGRREWNETEGKIKSRLDQKGERNQEGGRGGGGQIEKRVCRNIEEGREGQGKVTGEGREGQGKVTGEGVEEEEKERG